jgi:hypothetical protein
MLVGASPYPGTHSPGTIRARLFTASCTGLLARSKGVCASLRYSQFLIDNNGNLSARRTGRCSQDAPYYAGEAVGPFTFGFAAYADWSFQNQMVSPENCPCAPSAASYMAGGFYRDDLSTGLGIAMPSGNFASGRIGGGGATEPTWRNRSFHLSGQDSLDGIVSKAFVWYVLAGPWRNAEAFANLRPIANWPLRSLVPTAQCPPTARTEIGERVEGRARQAPAR